MVIVCGWMANISVGMKIFLLICRFALLFIVFDCTWSLYSGGLEKKKSF